MTIFRWEAIIFLLRPLVCLSRIRLQKPKFLRQVVS